MLAPIVLFVYNRPEHTRQTLNALSNNSLASQSTLYIFSDGEPDHCSDETVEKIKQVRLIIREKQWCKEVIIKEAKQNQGLAKSVINGVTEVITKHGKIIVLEDDLIPSHYFLDFMNQSLDRYEEHQEIFQISGFSFPSKKIKSENSSYFLPLTSTWGWATWKRVWDLIDFECNDYSVLKKNKKLAYRFNFNGSYNYKKMFIQQMESQKISSWGIRFYWNAFKNDALILFPDKSLILNNGWDNSGRHNDNYNVFPINNWDDIYQIRSFPKEIGLNLNYVDLISKYLKKRTSILTKLSNKLYYISKQILSRN
ncbi:MAG: glycosyltransferase [Bacteroidota bacterium]|nr:glycosyltransferase [Bacteroidota bacterium]